MVNVHGYVYSFYHALAWSALLRLKGTEFAVCIVVLTLPRLYGQGLDNLVWGVAKCKMIRCTMPNGYKKQRKPIWAIVFIALVIVVLILIAKSCDKCYNSVKDPHFNCDGTLVIDSTDIDSFKIATPKRIKFYIEVSEV